LKPAPKQQRNNTGSTATSAAAIAAGLTSCNKCLHAKKYFRASFQNTDSRVIIGVQYTTNERIVIKLQYSEFIFNKNINSVTRTIYRTNSTIEYLEGLEGLSSALKSKASFFICFFEFVNSV
jgi:hypothetical protein